MGNEQNRILSTAELREYIRQRYTALMREMREKDELHFRYTAKGYYIERIAAETGYSFDYVGRIINGRRWE